TEGRLNNTEGRLNNTEGRLNNTEGRLNTTEGRLTTTEERLNTTEGRLNNTEGRLNNIEGRLTTIEGQLISTKDCLAAMDEHYIRNDSFLKNDLAQQKRLITMFLEEARQRLPKPFNSEQLQTIVSQEEHLLDAFYVAFEEEFRGSRQVIIDRLKVYLPLIEEAKIGTQLSPIIDVGCGRGEWLELLRESGYTVKGIDNNRVMVEQCQARGLEVSEFDVIDYLKSLPDASLGMVTGFHIIEHLPFLVLIKLLSETHRVLKPGGLAIFETPNPQNILVGANNFYTDPTHRNPLPSNLTKFMVENMGFASVKIMNLNPYEESFQLSGSEVAERFNEYFYGPQDYAVVGYKL
ncbi:methyltransferase domain-containing protein, partial [Limnofasciculus baicalensis]